MLLWWWGYSQPCCCARAAYLGNGCVLLDKIVPCSQRAAFIRPRVRVDGGSQTQSCCENETEHGCLVANARPLVTMLVVTLTVFTYLKICITAICNTRV